jgi:TatD DNase family protein
MLVDSHCHLDFPDFAGDIDSVVARAQAAGLSRIVTVSTRLRAHPAVLALAERFADVYCSVGTHPHYAHEEIDATADSYVVKSRAAKVVGIGEAGLDYHYAFAPKEAQLASLRTQITAARSSQLPLIIHCRQADADMAEILEQEMKRGKFAAVLHCFTGSRELARRGVELGCYISFSGILTFKNSGELRAIAAELPADRILVETDAPYLAPQPRRGKRNEPAYVVETARVLAECRGVDLEEIGGQTTENFFRLFTKVPREPARR